MSQQTVQKPVSLKLNMIMNMLLTVSSMLFPIITFPYVSRVVGAEGIGKVTFVTSVITYFSMFAQLGIPTYGIRACAKVRDDKKELSRVVQEILLLNTGTCILAYVALGIAMVLVPRFANEKLLFLVIGSTILLNAIGIEWLYKALEQYSYITIRSLICKVVALIALFLLVHSEKDYVIYGGISIFATAASNVLNFINLRKYVTLRPIGGYQITRHVKEVLVFFAMSIAITIYTNLDNVMLGFMQGDVEVGYYTAAVKIKLVLVSVVTAVSTVLLPRASYYVDRGMLEEFYRITKKAMHFVIIMALPCVVYFTIFAREGILLLSGEEFLPAIPAMQVIMPTLLFIGITNILGIQIMVPLGKEKIVLYSTICGAVIDLVANLIAIPIWGAAGAALGTTLAELAVLVFQVCAIRQVAQKVFADIRLPILLIANVIAVAASYWVKSVSWMADLQWNAFLALAVSAVCFFGAYLMVLLLGKETIVSEVCIMVLNKIRRKED